MDQKGKTETVVGYVLYGISELRKASCEDQNLGHLELGVLGCKEGR